MINKCCILNGAQYFSSGISQTYLVFIPAEKYLKYFSDIVGLIGGNLTECQKKNIENITKSDNNFAPTFVNHDSLPDINFNGHCLINNVYILIKVITQLHG